MLQLFYSNPNRAFYVREITRKIDEQINSVRRELANLLSIGIIGSKTEDNNRLYYEVNQQYEHYNALAAIFGTGVIGVPEASTGATSDATKDLKHLGNVEIAFYTGQFTRDETSGIDFLVVGDVNSTQLSKFVADLEKQEGKEISYTVMTPDEFKYRRQVNDRFLSLVLTSKKQILVDKHNALEPEKTAKSKKEK